jgi:hypothetical protein
MYQRIVPNARWRLPIRLPTSTDQTKNTVGSVDLLPRGWRCCATVRSSEPLAGAQWAAYCVDRFRSADCGSARLPRHGREPEILPRACKASGWRSRVYRGCNVRDLEAWPFAGPCVGSFASGGRRSSGVSRFGDGRSSCAHQLHLARAPHHPRPAWIARVGAVRVGASVNGANARGPVLSVSHSETCAELTMAGVRDAAILVGGGECFKGTTGGIR